MTRKLGEMSHDECAPWCDHDPERHAENCNNSFCDGYECLTSEEIEARDRQLLGEPG